MSTAPSVTGRNTFQDLATTTVTIAAFDDEEEALKWLGQS
jgi:hypothetical protein